MKIYIDREKVNKRAQLANLASVGGLVILLISVLVPLFIPGTSTISAVLSILGAGVAMVGIYLANRWVRKPRPEESLDRALKAFDEHFHIYHYSSLPCDHLLLTPTGVVALNVVNLAGNFTYRNGHWKEAMTVGRALRYIVEERVDDPVITAQAGTGELEACFEKEFGKDFSVPIKVLTVFTHPAALLDIEGSSVPACKIEKLRKQATINGQKLAPEIYEKLSAYLERVTVS
jgi:hypothetical protein